jgi:hypothetical protein
MAFSFISLPARSRDCEDSCTLYRQVDSRTSKPTLCTPCNSAPTLAGQVTVACPVAGVGAVGAWGAAGVPIPGSSYIASSKCSVILSVVSESCSDDAANSWFATFLW